MSAATAAASRSNLVVHDPVRFRVWDPSTGEEDQELMGVRWEKLGPEFVPGITPHTRTPISSDGRVFMRAVGKATLASNGSWTDAGPVAEVWDRASAAPGHPGRPDE
jgi:hypothetical protein